MTLHLVADVLDAQVVDANDENAGRVDGIVLRLRPDAPPLVSHIEISPITLLARFSRRIAAWYAPRDARLGPGRGEPYRVEWHRITRTKLNIQLDRPADQTPIGALETWLKRWIVSRIPGA